MDELEVRAAAVLSALAALGARLGHRAEAAVHLDAFRGHVDRALGRMRFKPVDRHAVLHPSNFGSTPRTPPPSFPSFAGARALDGPHAAEVRALLDALAAWQEQLVFEADGQEYVDALNNSRELLLAAGHLDLAEPHALALAHVAARAR